MKKENTNNEGKFQWKGDDIRTKKIGKKVKEQVSLHALAFKEKEAFFSDGFNRIRTTKEADIGFKAYTYVIDKEIDVPSTSSMVNDVLNHGHQITKKEYESSAVNN